jgi:hypothetical protein
MILRPSAGKKSTRYEGWIERRLSANEVRHGIGVNESVFTFDEAAIEQRLMLVLCNHDEYVNRQCEVRRKMKETRLHIIRLVLMRHHKSANGMKLQNIEKGEKDHGSVCSTNSTSSTSSTSEERNEMTLSGGIT